MRSFDNKTIWKAMNYDHKDLVKDWKQTCAQTDGCTTYLFKWVIKFLLWVARRIRNYGCSCCTNHDFDFRFGPKYDITFSMANVDLYNCVVSSGHPWIAKVMYSFVNGPIGKRIWNNYRRKEK